MIRVEKDYDNPPANLKSKGCKTKIKEALNEKDKHKFSAFYYRHPEVLEKLFKIYNHKCAYCETDTSAGATLQVEHYRPKRRIKDDATHKGYYWLGYEWSNLILACQKCNNAKSNHFPLESIGVRVDAYDPDTTVRADSPALLGEKPFLLNPEIDRPEDHFIFLPDGRMEGITERGEKTIEICKLSDNDKREDLILARKKEINIISEKISKYIDDYIQEVCDKNAFRYSLKNLFFDILKGDSPENQYSRLYWFMFSKFEIFFIKPLRKKQQKRIRKAFKLFKKGYL